MENSNLISVIVPVYNGEKYIGQCLENLLCQTYKNLEIIVINDGSTDNSAQIAANYPVKIINQKNAGLSAARNAGIDCATGEYIHFFDVDDLINLEFYEKMIEAIAQTNADIACGGVFNELASHRTEFFTNRLLLTTVEDKIAVTKVGRYGYVWRYLFKKSFLEEISLKFEVGVLVEDLYFSLTAVYFAKKVVTVPDAVYYYKKRENSIMTTKQLAHRKKRHEGWKKAKEFRQKFANEHNFQIPGIATKGFGAFIVKYFA